jgi:hypothetical protein
MQNVVKRSISCQPGVWKKTKTCNDNTAEDDSFYQQEPLDPYTFQREKGKGRKENIIPPTSHCQLVHPPSDSSSLDAGSKSRAVSGACIQWKYLASVMAQIDLPLVHCDLHITLSS